MDDLQGTKCGLKALPSQRRRISRLR